MKGLELEQRLRERIRDFDLPALLALLAREGYGEEDIEYRGHRTLVHQGHLVHDLQLIDVPRRRALLTVNLGLLGAQSPLPAFLLQTLQELSPLEAERMERFLGYFDHELLRARVAGLYPERNASLMPGWETAAPSRLSLLSLTSPSTLHWLFTQAFPEAEVLVRREVRVQPVATRGTRMSVTSLGDSAALGGIAAVPTGGMDVALFFAETHCRAGRPWAREAPHRLTHRVLPLFTQTSLPLAVRMVLRDWSAPARLQSGSSLGHSPLGHLAEGRCEFLLFHGDASLPDAGRIRV